MGGALFYVDALPEVGAAVTVRGDEGFHAASVRRIRPGERVLLSDGAGQLAWCEVEGAERAELHTTVTARWRVPTPTPRVTVVQALPKAERSELAVELATEAGADEFVAWQASRCVARWDAARAEKGLRRWRAVVRSAARQSRRAHIPPVTGLVSTDELVRRVAGGVAAGGVVLLLHEQATGSITECVTAQAASLTLVVGPEGGLTDDEVDALTGAGAAAVRLGPTVMRTSTAAAVALGAIGVLTARWERNDPVRS